MSDRRPQQVKRPPKADKEQRKHLLLRIHNHAHKLATQLRRREGRNNWDEKRLPEPPEVIAARKIVDDYEEEQQRLWEAEQDKLVRLNDWLKEQVLFADCANALSLTKQFEVMPLADALASGQTMEDRNDRPALGFSTTPHI